MKEQTNENSWKEYFESLGFVQNDNPPFEFQKENIIIYKNTEPFDYSIYDSLDLLFDGIIEDKIKLDTILKKLNII